jgi:hypothetical protein
MLDEVFEDIEFARREFDQGTGFDQFELLEVDRNIAETELFVEFVSTMRTAEQSFDAGHQFHETEWFGDVIVSASFQAGQLVVLGGPRGEHDHRHFPKLVVQHPAPIQAVQVGQHQVEHDQVGALGALDCDLALSPLRS